MINAGKEERSLGTDTQNFRFTYNVLLKTHNDYFIMYFVTCAIKTILKI